MAFHFKIQIARVFAPPVWRKVVVSEDFTFMQMHHVIAAAFGWHGRHNFQFSPRGYGSAPEIGLPHDGKEGAADIKLRKLFRMAGQRFEYIYDFKDDWHHIMMLEAITPDIVTYAELIDGKGACPPDSCGGPDGWEQLKKIITEPHHPDFNHAKELLHLNGHGTWDAQFFDIENSRLRVQDIKL